MAFKITKPAPSGAKATYWRIAGLMHHDWEKALEIYMHGYVDQPTRRAKKDDGSQKYSALCTGVCRLSTEQYDALVIKGELPNRAKLYQFLATLPDWEDANLA